MNQITEKIRKYGSEPYRVAVVHGGPGAAGEMAPVARELAKTAGVLEPFQTKGSIAGQVEELRETLTSYGDLPLVLIGHSWGAWLSFILAACYPAIVWKLILVGSGPFEAKYLPDLDRTRRDRLTENELLRAEALAKALADPEIIDKSAIFTEFGRLMSKADSFCPDAVGDDPLRVNPEIFQSVMQEAVELRRSGELLRTGSKITCPVVAIHGDYDPHPSQGVAEPLQATLKDFRFILLPDCGHTPWKERLAREEFYRILRSEIF